MIAGYLLPEKPWGYALAMCAALASVPVTFPLAAYALNRGVAWVDENRRRNLFDDPVETSRKQIEAMIVEARNMQGAIPPDPITRNEFRYHDERIEHWIRSTDIRLSHVSGHYAAKWFMVREDSESWRPYLGVAATSANLRVRIDEFVEQLRQILEAVPIDRRKWARKSASIDIMSGKTLRRFLLDASAEPGHGASELATWIGGIQTSLPSTAPEYAHLFADDTYSDLATPAERVEYVDARLKDLEQIWRDNS